MRALLLFNLHSLRAKYWLIPSLMALGAVVLSVAVVALDGYLGTRWLEGLPWFYANQPSGARSILSTIAASMITVAGVTFSITIAALATAASSFGPRLISNFMQDRGNQVTLGTFIATFVFCLLVLRTIRDGQEGAVDFVPHIALFVALLLALASLGVLIYFIHHVPESLHISNVIARLGRALHGQVEELFPEQIGERASEAAGAAPSDPVGRSPFGGSRVLATNGGYIQYIDSDGLMRHARKHDLVVCLRSRPGDFVNARAELAVAASADAATGLDAEALDGVRRAIVIGGEPSQEQDVLYLVNRLVEVAARALSPGTNDVFTALGAIDWLGAGLANLGSRETPEDVRRDDRGVVRVVAPARTYEQVAAATFDQLRPYVAVDRNATLHMMRMIAGLAPFTAAVPRRAVLLAHAEALRAAARESFGQPRDLEALDEAFERASAALRQPLGAGSQAPALSSETEP